jgi:hypothetical protein
LFLDKPEDDPASANLSHRPIPSQNGQLYEALESPERQADLDAGRVDDLAIELVRKGSANQQLVDFGAPASSFRF